MAHWREAPASLLLPLLVRLTSILFFLTTREGRKECCSLFFSHKKSFPPLLSPPPLFFHFLTVLEIEAMHQKRKRKSPFFFLPQPGLFFPPLILSLRGRRVFLRNLFLQQVGRGRTRGAEIHFWLHRGGGGGSSYENTFLEVGGSSSSFFDVVVFPYAAYREKRRIFKKREGRN